MATNIGTQAVLSVQNAASTIKENLGVVGAGVGGLALGGAVGFLAGRSSHKKKSKSKRRAKSKYSRKRYNNHKRYRSHKRKYYPHTAGKRRDTSHRRIRFTKNGQPYIIKGNGRAMFISKKSARTSRKRHGGRY